MVATSGVRVPAAGSEVAWGPRLQKSDFATSPKRRPRLSKSYDLGLLLGSSKGGVAIGLDHVLRLDGEKMIQVAGSNPTNATIWHHQAAWSSWAGQVG